MKGLSNITIKIVWLLITAIIISAFTLGTACNNNIVEDNGIGEPAEEETGEDEINTPAPEETGEVTEEESVDMVTGSCYNPFFPVVEGRVWNYTIESTGSEPSSYSMSFTDIKENSFVQVTEFPDLTLNSGWTCSDGGIKESDYRQLDVSGPETGQEVKFETISSDGISFPAADLLDIGYTWSITYELVGTVTAPGIEAEVNATAVMDSEVIGFEDVTVPAGDFKDALKVAHDNTITMTSDFFNNTIVTDSISWYAENTGWVKDEGSLGDIQTTTVLESIE